MAKFFELINFINQLVTCEPRAGKNLVKTERLILKKLKQNGLVFRRQPLVLVKTNNVLVGNLVKE